MPPVMDDARESFQGLVPPRDEILEQMEREAAREKIPIIGPLAGHLLFLLCRISKACRVLELGTAMGYSGIFLARGLVENKGRLWTVEKDPAMAQRAIRNFSRAKVADAVEVLVGDALEVMRSQRRPFDLIFLDMDKPGYETALAQCARLLEPGGLLVADNTGFDEARPFNRAIADSPDFLAVQLLAFLPGHSPENDGICLALKL